MLRPNRNNVTARPVNFRQFNILSKKGAARVGVSASWPCLNYLCTRVV